MGLVLDVGIHFPTVQSRLVLPLAFFNGKWVSGMELVFHMLDRASNGHI